MEALPVLLGIEQPYRALFWILFNICYFSIGICNGGLGVYNLSSLVGFLSSNDPTPFMTFLVFALVWPVFLVPNVLTTIILWARWAYGSAEDNNADN